MRGASWILATMAFLGCERAVKDTKTVELPVAKVTVQLIDPGAEPRAPLRNVAPVGAHGTYKATLTSQLVKPQVRALPTRTVTYESTLVDISADGARHMRQRVIAASDAKLVDHSTDSWRDARGVYLRPTLMTAPADAERLGESAGQPEQMTASPVEAVGVGARWHEDVTYGAQRASVDAELIARDGTHVRVRSTYHVDTTLQGRPATRDGTMTGEWDQSGSEGSLHAVETVVLEYPQGRAEATVTTDVVQQP